METASLRKNDVLASNLLFGALLFSSILTFIRVAVLKVDNPFAGTKHITSTFVISTWVVGYVLSIGQSYAIRLGKRWAKILFLISFVLAALFAVFYHNKVVASLHTDVLYVVNYVVGYAVQLVALVVMFRKPEPALA